MSGGSMEYLTYKVANVANELECKANPPLQRAFGSHLQKVAEALHDIEWVWSGDYGSGDEEEAIREVLKDVAGDRVLDVLKSDAQELITQLQGYIDKL